METMTTILPNLYYTTANSSSNSTVEPDSHLPYPIYVGYICAFVAVIMYGSNFVPVKKFYTGDGMFFQYILCSGIFLVGVVVQLIRNSEFQPLVMLGGTIWATGNLCVVPVIKTIGLGLGMSIWGTIGLVFGWASGRFGFFGTKCNTVQHSAMNYGGVGLAFASILLYVMVKNEVSGSSTDMEVIVECGDSEPLLPSTSVNKGKQPEVQVEEEDDKMFIETLSPIRKRIIGTFLSVFSGVMYGLNFMPSIYVKDNFKGASLNDLDYTFSQFTGIYVTSSIYFFIYCIFQKNRPKVYPTVILPGILSGIMWGIATACWFIANAELSEAVSFPIVSTAPCAIASLFWGVLIFREVRGLRNIAILLVAFCIMTSGVILAGFSK
ncbi:transmembrane protein 144-like isoform X2 [Physella acuta]|uniref:transmembrane protein 144-like isoform X2 n=1 Tax=Physella acuta TaxID=109671 RepID=UPI0027DB6B83|nr:transmembrane protein 144-like isoform X2 [Physella acuta]